MVPSGGQSGRGGVCGHVCGQVASLRPLPTLPHSESASLYTPNTHAYTPYTLGVHTPHLTNTHHTPCTDHTQLSHHTPNTHAYTPYTLGVHTPHLTDTHHTPYTHHT